MPKPVSAMGILRISPLIISHHPKTLKLNASLIRTIEVSSILYWAWIKIIIGIYFYLSVSLKAVCLQNNHRFRKSFPTFLRLHHCHCYHSRWTKPYPHRNSASRIVLNLRSRKLIGIAKTQVIIKQRIFVAVMNFQPLAAANPTLKRLFISPNLNTGQNINLRCLCEITSTYQWMLWACSSSLNANLLLKKKKSEPMWDHYFCRFIYLNVISISEQSN